MHHRWADYLPQTSAEKVRLQAELHEERMRENVTQIAELAYEHGIALVLMRQPIQSWTTIDKERPSYEESCVLAGKALSEQGELPADQVIFFVHRRLVGVLDELASTYGLPVVDNIELIGEIPEGLVTKVHLSEEANHRLAREMARVIEPILRCRSR